MFANDPEEKTLKQQRKTNSERCLQEALARIAERKSIYKISIKELCEEAGINRTTFYRHYRDMPEYLDSTVTTFLEAMTSSVSRENPYLMMLTEANPERYFLRCAEFVERNASFIRAMISANGYAGFQGLMQQEWTRQIREALTQIRPKLPRGVDEEVLVYYLSAAVWGFISAHLDQLDNSLRLDPAHLAKQQTLIFYNGTLAALGLVKPIAR